MGGEPHISMARSASALLLVLVTFHVALTTGDHIFGREFLVPPSNDAVDGSFTTLSDIRAAAEAKRLRESTLAVAAQNEDIDWTLSGDDLSLPALAGDYSYGHIGLSSLELGDHAIQDIIFLGESKETAFLLSTSYLLWISTDTGATWQSAMSLLPGSLDPSSENGLFGITAMYISPVDPDYVFFVGQGDTHWTTKDGGKTFNTLHDKFHPVNFVMSIENAGFILAAKESKGCTTGESACKFEAYFTDNFGEVWEYLTDYVTGFAWGVDDDDIFFARSRDRSGDQTYDVDIIKTPDFGHTFETVIEKGVGFLQSSVYMFVPVIDKKDSTKLNLMVSTSNGQTFKRADFPVELDEFQYFVVAASEQSVFVAVWHGGSQNVASLYMSGGDGVRYSMSLDNIARSAGSVDFHRVKGFTGVFIANYYDGLASDGDLESLITFDKGGLWQSITAPTRDMNGDLTNCAGGCSLHIHGRSQQFGKVFAPIFTSPAGIGLILASGNMGYQLSSSVESTRLLFSRDAGQGWYEVRNSSHLYVFGDHGALMVAAYNQQPTTHILYSWDEGETWTPFVFETVAVQVKNIYTNDLNDVLSFVVEGLKGDGTRTVYSIDFSNYHERACTGIDSPSQPGSDYELWTPEIGGVGNGCFLGRRITYTRRKRDSQCYNGVLYEPQTSPEYCACTIEDYECDEGFARKSSDSTECVQVDDIKMDDPIDPDTCLEGDYAYVYTGYRLIPGDVCQDGLDLRPHLDICPPRGNPTDTGSSGGGGGGGNTNVASHVVFLLFFMATVGFVVFVGHTWYLTGELPAWLKRRRGDRPSGYVRAFDDEADANFVRT